MADYATINTHRLRVRYRSNGLNHAMVFRGPREMNAATAQDSLKSVATSFLNALAPWRFTDWAVIGCDFAAADSEIFLPVVAITPNAGQAEINNIAQQVVFATFVGRSVGGSRTVLYVYGINSDPVGSSANEQDFRYQRSEYAVVSAALTTLENNSATLRAIDNKAVAWKQYANIAYNAYYQRKRRG